MVNPSDIGSALSGAGSSILPTIMNYIKWGLLLGIIAGGLYGTYIFIQYKYKVTIFERGGSGNKDDEESHFIRKIRWDRAREIKDKSGTSQWQLFLSRKRLEPINLKHIYPGNKVFLYRVAPDCYIPTDFRCSNPEATFNPIPQTVRRWMALEIQQAAQDYQVQSGWDKYGNIAIMAGTILFCLILVGVVVYFTYGHANGVVGALNGLTSSLKDVNVIQGIGQ